MSKNLRKKIKDRLKEEVVDYGESPIEIPRNIIYEIIIRYTPERKRENVYKEAGLMDKEDLIGGEFTVDEEKEALSQLSDRVISSLLLKSIDQ